MAFSYDHHAFFLDAAYLPTSSPMGMPLLPQQAEELNSAPSCFPYSYQSSAEMIPYVSGSDHAKTYGRSSSPESATDVPSVDNATGDSPKTGDCEPHSSEKKRKKKDETCFVTTASHDKDAELSEISCRYGKTENKRKKAAGTGEPPAGFIQVRARRGQATDSHSLAERVRRERISQRMKMLQGLVPGCEKANGKAHMLDEIINYVQSLQNQVEFLSMRLASLSPMLYGFALDMDDYSNLQEKIMRRVPQTVPPADLRIHLDPTTSGNGSTNYQSLVDNSAPHLLQGQGPNLPQDSGSSMVQIGEERHLLRQIELVNLCCFH